MSTASHGTRLMYRERGCRCDACRAWNTAQKRVYDDRVKRRDGISVTQKYRPGRIRMTAGECSKCGNVLHKAALTDPLCAPCRGNRPGYNIKITRADRLAIYARDDWKCQLCDEPVDPDVDPRSRWGATLDHITPKSLGGSDHPENLRLAHRRCNSVRGARPDNLQEAS